MNSDESSRRSSNRLVKRRSLGLEVLEYHDHCEVITLHQNLESGRYGPFPLLDDAQLLLVLGAAMRLK